MGNANVKHFTDANFKAEVLDSSVPVLVDFWAEWCGPCRMLAPAIDALADEFAGKVKVGKVDTDANQNTAANYGIMAIPTVIFFKGGKEVKRVAGLKSKQDLAATLNSLV